MGIEVVWEYYVDIVSKAQNTQKGSQGKTTNGDEHQWVSSLKEELSQVQHKLV